jgi:sulfhydrogenase subunit beta (sulfur reductase)
MSCFELSKRNLNALVKTLNIKNDVYAPVDEGGFASFVKVPDAESIVLNEHSYLPLKRFFFPPKEVLLRFERDKLSVPVKDAKERVIIGAKRCDLNSIAMQDIMFLRETRDPYYKKERERTLLIGYHCKKAYDEYCFCGSMELKDYQDIMLYDRGDSLLAEVTSKKGEFFVRKYQNFFKETDAKPATDERATKDADRLMNKDISGFYENGRWKKGVDLCLSCGACTALCPSCYCFSIEDESNIDLNSGARTRTQASCQLKSFTAVTGGHVFRDTREDRFKHRIYHQLQYFKERHGMNLCTGCGRCIRFCPTRIDFVDLVNGMRK